MPRQKSAPSVRADDKTQLRAEGEELHFDCDTRYYRVRGLAENHCPQRLQVNLLVQRDELVYTDTLDLYRARARRAFVQAVATELYVEEETVKRDVGQLLLELERLQQAEREASLQPEAAVELTAAERRAALELLRDGQLTERILADYAASGLVGEETNKLVCYLACSSRLLTRPLAVLIQSSSAAGKTSLMDATLRFMPPEAQVRYSALTGQSLYYMGQQDLRHKILAVAEEAGVGEASYALKLLQSDGSLRIAAAGKSRGTARQSTETYQVQGPVMMLLTTTAEEPDEELANRCLTLQVNESPEQTEAIQAEQRLAYTLEGQQQQARRLELQQLHQNAQRLLERLPVVIPAAEQLAFRHDQTRMRREHAKYLSLIAASALVHQYQRPRFEDEQGQPYLQATADDLQLANRLFREALGRSLESLLPQTRLLLSELGEYVRSRARSEQKSPHRVRFTQRELREALGWGDFALRRHLARLLELEYVLAYRTKRGNQRHYQLLDDGQPLDERNFLLGLSEVDHLKETLTHPSVV